ncbi:unnamed protein product [Thlaspi arvense]|uniref:Protease Do-like PDZ domain-containing protein n=1 Tax=Thlaspi arvense TaxID=13288 RepID=A0AAU9SND3_THLAR|nr:unnamed protein product [Thlaspi arvense]
MVLFDKINIGYADFTDLQVERVNGVELKNMQQLRKLIKSCRTEDLRLDLEKGKVIVLNYKSAKEESWLILKRYGIASPTSR